MTMHNPIYGVGGSSTALVTPFLDTRVDCTALATSAAIAMGIEAASGGADALLCAVPPYVKPTQEGIIAHIRAIAHATDLPVVLYDVPSRSGVAITDDNVARLHDAELIVGLKGCH